MSDDQAKDDQANGVCEGPRQASVIEAGAGGLRAGRKANEHRTYTSRVEQELDRPDLPWFAEFDFER